MLVTQLWRTEDACTMMISIAFACLLGMASSSPIVQTDVLNDLVAQRSSGRDGHTGQHTGQYTGQHTGQHMGQHMEQHTGQYTGQLLGLHTGQQTGQYTGQLLGQHTGQQTGQLLGQQTGQQTGQYTGQLLGQQTDTLDSFTPVLLPITDAPVTHGDRPKVEVTQTAAQSSSESDSSNQSESVEASPENLDSQDTSESMMSEDVTSQMEMQLADHIDSGGNLKDDSRGSEENIRRGWIRAFGNHILYRVHAVPIMGGVATEAPVGAVEVGLATAETVGVATEGAPVAAASESRESEESIEQWRRCRERADNGDCITYRAISDSIHPLNHIPHGLL